MHNICLLGFGGGGAQTPSSSFYTPPPQPLSSCPCRPINKFCFKESQTKGLWPTHLRRNKKCRFSIFHSTCTCLWVSSWATRLSTNKPISVFHLLSFKHSLGPWTNQLPKLYTSVIRSDIFAFDWCNLVCSSFFQHLNVKVIY